MDSGVVEGDEIPVFYDPMIAKVIAHGRDRGQAIERLSAALDAFVIRGVSHNVLFVSSVLASRRFREGRLSTGFIDQEYPEGFDPARMGEGRRARLAGAGGSGALPAGAGGGVGTQLRVVRDRRR